MKALSSHKMLAETDYLHITVQELAARARINRKPFTCIIPPWTICCAGSSRICSAIYRQWVENGRREPMEEMIRLSIRLISHGLTPP